MKKLKNKFIAFMTGRNGLDNLNNFIFIIYLISLFINIIFPNVFSIIFETLIIFLWFFRLFSKDLPRRQRENAKFLSIKNKIYMPFRRIKNKIKNRKDYVYKKCPNCKKTLKLKRLKGTHTVKCPVCGNSFNITIKK